MMAPKEATFVRKDILSPAVINLCNAFDSIGRVGSFASNAEQVTEKKEKKDIACQGSRKNMRLMILSVISCQVSQQEIWEARRWKR